MSLWLKVGAFALLAGWMMLHPAAAAPINDQFANAIVLSGASVVTNGSNVGATKQPGEPNHAGDAGGRSVWWIWTAPFTGSVVIHTSGSTFDTLLGVYTGASVSSLTLITANDQDPLDPLGGDTNRVKFNAIVETVYAIAVDGYAGDSGVILLTISPPPRPPNDDFAQRTVLTGASIHTNGSNRRELQWCIAPVRSRRLAASAANHPASDQSSTAGAKPTAPGG